MGKDKGCRKKARAHLHNKKKLKKEKLLRNKLNIFRINNQ